MCVCAQGGTAGFERARWQGRLSGGTLAMAGGPEAGSGGANAAGCADPRGARVRPRPAAPPEGGRSKHAPLPAPPQVGCSNGRAYSVEALEALDEAGYENLVWLKVGWGGYLSRKGRRGVACSRASSIWGGGGWGHLGGRPGGPAVGLPPTGLHGLGVGAARLPPPPAFCGDDAAH